MHYHDASIQIGPSDDVEVFRQSCGKGDNWLKIKERPIEYGILIDGATVAESDALAHADATFIAALTERLSLGVPIPRLARSCSRQ